MSVCLSVHKSVCINVTPFSCVDAFDVKLLQHIVNVIYYWSVPDCLYVSLYVCVYVCLPVWVQLYGPRQDNEEETRRTVRLQAERQSLSEQVAQLQRTLSSVEADKLAIERSRNALEKTILKVKC